MFQIFQCRIQFGNAFGNIFQRFLKYVKKFPELFVINLKFNFESSLLELLGRG